jgi:tryptophanyl-tRNA synthetase
MIADAQALTDNFDNPEKVRQNIIEVALDYLSVGLDPAKSNLFIQSQISELTELTFFYSDLVTVSRLQRNPTVKAEIQLRNFEASIPVGFFTYPISQEVLVEPEVLLPDNAACMRLPGTDGKAKMSKSLGNCIYLADTEADVKKKIMNMYTDPTHIQISDPGHIEGNCVFTYLDAFSNQGHFEEYLPEYQNLEELKEHYKRGGLGDVKIKKFLNNVIQEELAPIRARRAEFEKDIPAVYEILKKGSDVAREAAAQTLAEVKRAMRINYFEDEELIRAQSEKYVR